MIFVCLIIGTLILIIILLLFWLFFLSRKINLISKKKDILVFDKRILCERIFEAVKYCSLQKIGMIITFEKNDDLTKKIPRNSGIVINAPINSDLLITIFYPGTKLHDGAVIIRKDKIYMASVMFNNKIRNNKFSSSLGARHRAAVAISEISDSITVVVSEQTGKISFFKKGLMESVHLNKFINILSSAIEC